MRMSAALLLALLSFSFALAPLRAEAEIKAALLAWEAAPARPDVQRVASELVALAQAELSAEPGFAWVERDELDNILAETERSLDGTLAPRSALRIGRIASGDIVVTGRLDAATPTPMPPRRRREPKLRQTGRLGLHAARDGAP